LDGYRQPGDDPISQHVLHDMIEKTQRILIRPKILDPIPTHLTLPTPDTRHPTPDTLHP
jgi:hypothetical protein